MTLRRAKCARAKLALAMTSAIGMITAGGVYADPAHGDQGFLDFNVKANEAGKALLQFAEETGVQVFLPGDVDQSIKLPALEGKYTIGKALDAILKDSGLTYKFTSENSVIISNESDKNSENLEQDESEEEVDEEIIVTGSRIARTPSQMAANVLVLDGDELRASGESTLEGALRRLPQNMFGASPVAATVAGSPSINGAINVAGASTINLRGLGSESTLILIDGRRIGKTGVFGGVSDITGIPFSAVERVEILLDGASSIYGSDAVGGVVNVIMKKDYQGLEITHEYGTPEQGGFEEHVFSVNGGFSWDGGQLRATYEHFQSSNLDGDERPESIANSQYHDQGSIVFDLFTYQGQNYTGPALISELGLPADTPTWELFFYPDIGFSIGFTLIPDGLQDGAGLSINDFTLLAFGDGSVATNSDASEGISLLPAQQRDSLHISFDQALNLWGSEVTLSGAVYYSERQTYAANGGFTFAAERLPLHDLFGWIYAINWYIPELGAKHYETNENIARWNLALDGSMGESWRWAIAAGQSRSKTNANYFNEQISTRSPEYSQLLDEGLNFFVSDIRSANSPELLAQLVMPESLTSSINEENTLDMKASGALFNLPGGDVYLAVGVDWRQEILESESSRDIRQLSSLNDQSVGAITGDSLLRGAFSRLVESKTQRSGYAELLLPLVGNDNAMSVVERLVLTGSARYDSYHEQGSGSTWSLGLVWNPISQITMRVNQSTSFVVPSFRDQLRETIINDIPTLYPDLFPNGERRFVIDDDGQVVGVDFIGVQIFGGNPDLEPETGSSRSVSLEFTPNLLPGFTARASWHNTEYSNRIGSPVTQLLDNVDYVALYPNISRDERGLLVMDFRSVNIGGLETAGIDYQLGYARDTSFGQFNASVNVGYTKKYNRVSAPGDDPLSQLGNISIASHTVIPATRYQYFVGWLHRGLSINLTADTSSKTVSTGRRMASSALGSVVRTVKPAVNANLTMSYDFEQGDLLAVPDWLQSAAVEFTVLNVLDDHTETSIIDMETGEPSIYSEFNANAKDPRGRMFRVSVTKRF